MHLPRQHIGAWMGWDMRGWAGKPKAGKEEALTTHSEKEQTY
jgi:hypothetical protein